MSKLAPDLQDKVREMTGLTAKNDGMVLNIALNYGGRDDIIRAVRRVCADTAEGTLDIGGINERCFSGYLDTGKLPDPELLIRTSGELRLSNFMLWQLSYSEIYVTDKLWPDFTYNDLLKAVAEYQKRERRFGK